MFRFWPIHLGCLIDTVGEYLYNVQRVKTELCLWFMFAFISSSADLLFRSFDQIIAARSNLHNKLTFSTLSHLLLRFLLHDQRGI